MKQESWSISMGHEGGEAGTPLPDLTMAKLSEERE